MKPKHSRFFFFFKETFTVMTRKSSTRGEKKLKDALLGTEKSQTAQQVRRWELQAQGDFSRHQPKLRARHGVVRGWDWLQERPSPATPEPGPVPCVPLLSPPPGTPDPVSPGRRTPGCAGPGRRPGLATRQSLLSAHGTGTRLGPSLAPRSAAPGWD